ncbi:MAG: CBS domain-containing protein [Polyangiaceae bacterium]
MADESSDKDDAAATKSDAEEGERPSLVEEVEPEIMAPREVAPRPKPHLPPPPPSLRVADIRPLSMTGNPKLARDLMTRQLFTIGPDDHLVSLEEHMERFHFRHLPVVEDDKPVGLISLADLLHASSSFLTNLAKEVDEIVHQLPAKRIMKQDFVTVRPGESLLEVAAIMWRTRAGCVMVTEEDGKLVGIITQGDFVKLSHHLLERQV